MNSLKYVYKSIVYSRRGESLIQAPPESLHANTFFSVADLKIVYYYYIPTLLELLRIALVEAKVLVMVEQLLELLQIALVETMVLVTLEQLLELLQIALVDLVVLVVAVEQLLENFINVV